MKSIRHKALIGILILFLLGSLIPQSSAQTVYQTYFWITETNMKLTAIRTTGDLTLDHVQLSEIIVGGQGNLTLLDGFYGEILCNYSIPAASSFNVLEVGNLDADAFNEIVAGSQDEMLVVALDYNTSSGKLVKLWEKNYNITHAQITDLTSDSSNEVLISDSLGNLTVFNKDGVLIWTKNLSTPIDYFQCLDFSQDGKIDRILVLMESYVALLNTSGAVEWQAELISKPLNGVVGDVQGTSELELIVKTQNVTNCFTQNGTLLWNSSSYSSSSQGLLLYNSSESQKFEILISGNTGSYLLNGSDGSIIRNYLSNSSVTCIAIGKIFGDTYDYLIMGDRNKNITIWTMEPVNGAVVQFINITLSDSVVDIILQDMNADGIPDIVTASSNGTVYVIGVPWFIDFNWLLIGIGIGCIVIVISIVILLKTKSSPSKTTGFHIK